MDQKLRNYYLETQVRNAAPGQLLIMLYDGLIDQAEQADAEIASTANSADAAGAKSVARCIDFMTELNMTLRPDVDPQLCGTLRNLYSFFAREFSEAYEKRDPKRIRSILPLIRELRDAWSQAYSRAGQGQLMVA